MDVAETEYTESTQHPWLETIVATVFSLAIYLGIVLYAALFYFFPILRPFLLIYLVWKMFDPAVEDGIGRPNSHVTNARFWKYILGYFPTKVIREAKLDPNKKYICGFHPHGFISLNGQILSGSPRILLNPLYPGLTFYPVAFPSSLRFPFFGDFLMAINVISCSKTCIRRVLHKDSGKGRVVVITVGGARESLYGKPGYPRLILNCRKGFVREAIKAGAELCPAYSFGETNIYNQVNNPPGSWLYKAQMAINKYFHYAIPIIYGRKWCPLVPNRTHLTTVMGRPIPVEQCDEPTPEMLDHYHKLYVEELYRIYNKYKDVYDKDRKTELTLVG